MIALFLIKISRISPTALEIINRCVEPIRLQMEHKIMNATLIEAALLADHIRTDIPAIGFNPAPFDARKS